MGGFSDKSGTLTSKFIVLELISTNIKTNNGIVSRDLIYKSQSNNVWNLNNLRALKM